MMGVTSRKEGKMNAACVRNRFTVLFTAGCALLVHLGIALGQDTPQWPIAGPEQAMHSYGAWMDIPVPPPPDPPLEDFHPGIDISSNVPPVAGKAVYAVEDVVVLVYKDDATGEDCRLLVRSQTQWEWDPDDPNDDDFRCWDYQHIRNVPAPWQLVGAHVLKGTPIGEIGDRYGAPPPAGCGQDQLNHLHLELRPGAHPYSRDYCYNPLLAYPGTDPGGNHVQVGTGLGGGKDGWFYKHVNTGSYTDWVVKNNKRLFKEDIQISVEITDDMGNKRVDPTFGTDGRDNEGKFHGAIGVPWKVSYWIDGPGNHDVGSAQDPRVLCEFDGPKWNWDLFDINAIYNAVDKKVNLPGLCLPDACYVYRVTSAPEQPGWAPGIDMFWDTDLVEGNVKKYPNADYRVHVIAQDKYGPAVETVSVPRVKNHNWHKPENPLNP